MTERIEQEPQQVIVGFVCNLCDYSSQDFVYGERDGVFNAMLRHVQEHIAKGEHVHEDDVMVEQRF